MKHGARAACAATLAVVGAGWVGVVTAAGLSTNPPSKLWQDHAAALDPPELWSIQAVPSPPDWRPVQLCTDSWIRTGFVRPGAMVGDQPCAPVGDAVARDGATAFQCRVNGQTLGTTTTLSGDLRTDFTARFALTNLGGFLAGRPGSAYEQTLRYRKLGPCPAGWALGEHTDRWGRRQPNAVVAHSSQITVR